jgi:hypothetical protein
MFCDEIICAAPSFLTVEQWLSLNVLAKVKPPNTEEAA